MLYSFGTGTMTGVRTDIANQTPVIFGVLQDIQLDLAYTTKPLTGQYQTPIAIARADLKITGKARFARIYSQFYQSIFFGPMATLAPGGVVMSVQELHTIPAASPYTVTVANAGSFAGDAGVVYASGGNVGLQLQQVPSGPAAGQYAVAAGVYTFASADAGAKVLVNYTYTTGANGNQITLTNQLMGTGPTFQVNLAESYNGKALNIQLNACVSDKLSLPFKNADWTINELDFTAIADSTNTIGYLSFASGE